MNAVYDLTLHSDRHFVAIVIRFVGAASTLERTIVEGSPVVFSSLVSFFEVGIEIDNRARAERTLQVVVAVFPTPEVQRIAPRYNTMLREHTTCQKEKQDIHQA